VIYNTALAARNAGNHEASAKYFEKATEINYGGSDAYYFLVREFITLKDSTRALAALQKGFEMYPDTTLILFELVNWYINTGNVEECMTYLEMAEEKESSNPSIYFAKGTLYEKMGQRPDAIKEYLKSLEVDPEFYNSWYNLGAAYYNTAVELYEVANTKEELEEYNKAKAEADDALKMAIEPMEKAHAIKPDDCDPLETLKTIYYRLGMEDKYDEIQAKLDALAC
jgi:tetratricopeptide (TPR) repeat protein